MREDQPIFLVVRTLLEEPDHNTQCQRRSHQPDQSCYQYPGGLCAHRKNNPSKPSVMQAGVAQIEHPVNAAVAIALAGLDVKPGQSAKTLGDTALHCGTVD